MDSSNSFGQMFMMSFVVDGRQEHSLPSCFQWAYTIPKGARRKREYPHSLGIVSPISSRTWCLNWRGVFRPGRMVEKMPVNPSSPLKSSLKRSPVGTADMGVLCRMRPHHRNHPCLASYKPCSTGRDTTMQPPEY